MLIIRPVKINDLEKVLALANKAGPGLTHLPKNYEALEKKINLSVASFKKTQLKPIHEDYFFVLTDETTNEIYGTCCILSKTGFYSPNFFYRIEELTPLKNLPHPNERRVLHLVEEKNGPSELGALFLNPDYRAKGVGKFLSLSRFLFIAAHPKRFTATIMANMRGMIENDTSIFWEEFGRNFLNLSLCELMQLRYSKGDAFLIDILPKYPIYCALLSEKVKSTMGMPHPHTQKALKMLEEEGFTKSNLIDPFDGGPIIFCQQSSVKTIKESKVGKISEISMQPLNSETFLISNEKLDFRACVGHLNFSNNGVIIDKETAASLQIDKEATIRYIPLG